MKATTLTLISALEIPTIANNISPLLGYISPMPAMYQQQQRQLFIEL